MRGTVGHGTNNLAKRGKQRSFEFRFANSTFGAAEMKSVGVELFVEFWHQGGLAGHRFWEFGFWFLVLGFWFRFAYRSLLTAYCLLLTAYRLPLTAYRLPLTLCPSKALFVSY